MQKHSPFSAAISYRRALGIVIPLCLVSLALAGIVISVANDMYAFVKPEREFVLVLAGNTDVEDLSKILRQNGIIKNPFVFEMYLRSKNKADDINTLQGVWTLSAKMSYREIVAQIF